MATQKKSTTRKSKVAGAKIEVTAIATVKMHDADLEGITLADVRRIMNVEWVSAVQLENEIQRFVYGVSGAVEEKTKIMDNVVASIQRFNDFLHDENEETRQEAVRLAEAVQNSMDEFVEAVAGVTYRLAFEVGWNQGCSDLARMIKGK